jgi:endonuclease/exonuclease/phosphatase family metal-dependent hydrolase
MPPPIHAFGFAVRFAVLSMCALVGCNAGAPEPAPRVAPSPAPVVVAPEVPVAAAAPAPSPSPRFEPDLRVATYNILAGRQGLDEVIAAVQSLDADIIGLQEVDRGTRRSGGVDQPQRIADALGMDVAFAHHREYDGGRIGVALLSRYAITKARRIALPTGGLASLDAEIALASDVMRVIVVHLHPTDPRDPPAKRAKMDAARMREASTVLEVARATSDPLVVLGDFNARPTGPEYAAFATVLRDACPDDTATWPATFPLVRIDYVWTSSALKSVGCPHIATSASDHRPVIADLVHAPD